MTAKECAIALWVFVKGNVKHRDAVIDLLVTNDHPREVAKRHGFHQSTLYDLRARFLEMVRDAAGNMPDWEALKSEREREAPEMAEW